MHPRKYFTFNYFINEIPSVENFRIMVYISPITKCQFIATLIILLYYIDVFPLEWQQERYIWEGHPALYYTILLYFILSLAIITN